MKRLNGRDWGGDGFDKWAEISVLQKIKLYIYMPEKQSPWGQRGEEQALVIAFF